MKKEKNINWNNEKIKQIYSTTVEAELKEVKKKMLNLEFSKKASEKTVTKIMCMLTSALRSAITKTKQIKDSRIKKFDKRADWWNDKAAKAFSKVKKIFA